MFEKIPYGVKVRVRGNEKAGFIAEYAICCYRFFPFMDNWNVVRYYGGSFSSSNTFPTLELAKEEAMKKYDSWIKFYKDDEKTKRLVKEQRNVVWKHP